MADISVSPLEEEYESVDTSLRRQPGEQSHEFLEVFARGNWLARILTKSWCGTVKKSPLRGLYWRIMLGYYPVDMSLYQETSDWFDPKYAKEMPPPKTPHCQVVETDNLALLRSWVNAVKEKRAEYEKVRQQHEVDPHKEATDKTVTDDGEEDATHDNPLCCDTDDSDWKKYFQKSDLEKMIHQDIIRLHFEEDFFQQQHIRDVMQAILVTWSLEHPEVSYRQGMNEILAVLLFTFTRDIRIYSSEVQQQAEGPIADKESEIEQDLGNLLNVLFDWKYLEHDAYNNFELVMTTFHLKTWYHVTPQQNANSQEGAQQVTPIVNQCMFIQNDLLPKFSKQLSEHLESLLIEPQVYALRWLRLLFAREFLLDDVLVMWDAVFADLCITNANKPWKDGIAQFGVDNFVPYVATAMIIFMQEDLVNADYNTAIKRLMRFPPITDVHHFVRAAVHSRYENDQLMKTIVDPPPKIIPAPPPVPPPSLVESGSPLNPNPSFAAPTTAVIPGSSPPSLTSTPGGRGGSHRTSKQIIQTLQDEVAKHKSRQESIGTKMERQLGELEQMWVALANAADGKQEIDQPKVFGEALMCVANLKKLKDVLLERISEDDLE